MTTRAAIRSELARAGLHPKKGLGQSFLVDDPALDAIAAAATSGGEATVVEIGGGLGTLTTRLADRAERVVALERDPELVPVLRRLLENRPNATVVEGDALQADFAAIGGQGAPAIAGNIPYNITTPILLRLLEQRAGLGRVTLMIQREVAERLSAEPGSRAYGSITVLFRLYADVSLLFDVGPECFLPSPKVTSAVISIQWLPAPRVAVDPAHLERVVRAAFAQRRKTLRNSLSSVFPRELVLAAGLDAGVSLDRRAETLSLDELARLASSIPGLSA